MKKSLYVLLLFITPLFIANCEAKKEDTKPAAQEQQAPEIKTIFENISIDDFNAIEPDTDIVILDVRTDEEVAQGKIENSIQIDFYSENFKDQLAELDPEKSYVVYCRSGGRSSQASKIMAEELGFKNVKNLEGGYNAYSSNNN